MAKKSVDDTKAKIEQLRLQLNGAMPTAHQLMENLGISENIANLVLQRMFVESPSKATAASEDSGSATSKGGMPNKKAKAAEPGSMPPPKAPTAAKKRPEPMVVEPAVVEPLLAPKVETKSEAPSQAPSATYRTQYNPELEKILNCYFPALYLGSLLDPQMKRTRRSGIGEQHKSLCLKPPLQSITANTNRPPLRVACFRPTDHHQLVGVIFVPPGPWPPCWVGMICFKSSCHSKCL